jgi:tight adherence protein B
MMELVLGLTACAAALVILAVVLFARPKSARVIEPEPEAKADAAASVFPVTLVLTVVIAAVCGALLAVAAGGGVAFLLVPLAIAAAFIGKQALALNKVTKRKAAFAEQLEDTLQLIASGLRAGHSLARAVESVSQDAASPTAEEFARISNETRLGRDLGAAMRDTAARMGSDDLVWAAQAVDIHREVGGNLSEVLDHVSETIRERNQVKRDIDTLSAEGRLSANVLFALPVFVGIALSLMAPGYLTPLLEPPWGWVLIGICVVLFAVAVVWIRAVVKIRF